MSDQSMPTITSSQNNRRWTLVLTAMLTVFLPITCKDQGSLPPKIEPDMWEPADDILQGLDVRSVQLHGDELYIAGRDGVGSIFKSSDGINWTLVADRVDSSFGGADVILFIGDTLIAGLDARYLYRRVSNMQWIPISPMPVIPTDIGVLGRDIYLGCNSQYWIGKVSSAGVVTRIHDSLDANCNRSTVISQLWVTKLLKGNVGGAEVLLASNVVTNKFIRVVSPIGIDCFSSTGLSPIDIFHGAHDLAWKGDTLLACTYATVKMFVGGAWSTFGDSLPMTPQSFRPYATAIAVHGSRVFVGTNYSGVLEWKPGKGWKEIAPGLPRYSDGFYDAISYLTVFKGRLLAAYGEGKPWSAQSRGLYTKDLSVQ